MALDPIRLGSANTTGWTFESGSAIEESPSGIQNCTVQALWPIGNTVLNNLPAAGTSVSAIEPTGYIPSTFVLDYSEAGPSIDYLEGQIARAKFKFKRQNPNRTGRTFAIVKSDSVINYQSKLNENSLQFIAYSGGGTATSGLGSFGSFGFPEPVATVRYNSTTQPGIGSGSVGQLYALPGSANAQGFPPAPSIFNPVSIPVSPGGSVTYYDAGAAAFILVGPVVVATTFNFITEYRPNVLGWQLEKIKSVPIAGGAFYDVTEEWRIYYLLPYGSTFVSAIPPVP